ncbi:hypothetical protein RRG08_000792 [Elysia crispata]|uniref:Uncharacterized protein n=1 Tax=Elysia crispata TaxID=231223 RepID=A0AAE0XMW9_9GAST|nr:hypothetical protein RRG08_000792 [Elysia crispata]
MSATCVGKLWAITSFVTSVATAIGFYFPYWIRGHYVSHDGEKSPLYFGTFRRCSYPRLTSDHSVEIDDGCGRYSTFVDIPSVWWQITTISVGSGVSLALVVSLTGLVSLCIADIITTKIARTIGLVQMAAGLVSLCIADIITTKIARTIGLVQMAAGESCPPGVSHRSGLSLYRGHHHHKDSQDDRACPDGCRWLQVSLALLVSLTGLVCLCIADIITTKIARTIGLVQMAAGESCPPGVSHRSGLSLYRGHHHHKDSQDDRACPDGCRWLQVSLALLVSLTGLVCLCIADIITTKIARTIGLVQMAAGESCPPGVSHRSGLSLYRGHHHHKDSQDDRACPDGCRWLQVSLALLVSLTGLVSLCIADIITTKIARTIGLVQMAAGESCPPGICHSSGLSLYRGHHHHKDSQDDRACPDGCRWLQVSLALLVSLTGLVSLCIADIITTKIARTIGLVQMAAGLLVGGGVAIYPNGWSSAEVRQACGGHSSPYVLGDCAFCWAFYLTSVGGALTLLCAALTCHSFHQKHDYRSVMKVTSRSTKLSKNLESCSPTYSRPGDPREIRIHSSTPWITMIRVNPATTPAARLRMPG